MEQDILTDFEATGGGSGFSGTFVVNPSTGEIISGPSPITEITRPTQRL